MLQTVPKALVFVIFALVVSGITAFAEINVNKVGDSVVDAEALTIDGAFGRCINGKSFQQWPVLSHLDHQYVAYYDKARHVCLARRKLPDGVWQVIRFEDYDFKSNDAHNAVSMGICRNDGTIHLAFDHHGHPLHYRVSMKGAASNPANAAWSEALFGPVVDELEPGMSVPSVTYPRFIQTPDGGLQLCYRRGGSGNGDRMLVDYDPGEGHWKNTRQIDSREGIYATQDGESASRCSYPNGYDYGPMGKLHVTWVWREGAQTANHDLMYAYSDDLGFTWKSSAGQSLAGPPRVDSPGITAVEIPESLGLMNTHGQAVDSKGRIHAVLRHCTEESLAAAGSRPGEERWGPVAAWRYVHYWRADDGQWHSEVMPFSAGGRPKILMDRDDNVFLIYDGAERNSGNLYIAAATSDVRWANWHIVHVEKGPYVNEVLADPVRWTQGQILSVMVQDTPSGVHQPTPLRILDFEAGGK